MNLLPKIYSIILFISVITLCGCKDYKKLATEFETNLPDSLTLLLTYDNSDADMHFVY